MTIKELAQAVKRGVKLLDRKVPNWRRILRKHQDQFVFSEADHCVVGTLVSFSPALRGRANAAAFQEGVALLTGRGTTESAERYGFEGPKDPRLDWSDARKPSRDILEQLWRAEFEKP